ncbi:hypothetical protein F9817_22915 [Vibrio sp. CAIM 722]|uniref:Uncharacterized protein n=1 Tax=Vibrio eleionomae TaxID=2653505 RepID=A0A7X4LQA3_9VIBR|nr:FHA domain-containing protein [Vibrio eleionomae]MZI96041.1 hypothetical protein [Vibrio eleionomae]
MYELRVLSGVNRGASLPLIGEHWQIGSNDLADLVLLDAGIFPIHCELVFADEQWSIVAQSGEVTNREGHVFSQQTPIEAGSLFGLNGVWLTVVAAGESWDIPLPEAPIRENESLITPRPAKRKTLLPFLFGFISAVTIAATSTWAALYPDNQSNIKRQVEAPKIADKRQSLPQALDVEKTLKTMLTERELNTPLTLHHSSKSVQMKGALTQDQSQKLERMLARFHQQYRTPITIENSTSSIKHSLPFSIVQITSGPLASVVTSKGQRLFVGDEIQGLRLVSIDSGKVIFKGKSEFEISW